MTIFSTFNDKQYQFSGKGLIKSVRKNLPFAGIVTYIDFIDASFSDEWVTPIRTATLMNVKKVFEANQDVIHKSFGGNADRVSGDEFWNKRWFGWFKKVAMAHHAICIKNFGEEFGGYLIFVDSDIRIKKPFGEDTLRSLMGGKPIGFMKGDRPAIDSGFIVIDTNSLKPQKFYGYFMDLFLSGNFKTHTRWDDGYLMTKLAEACPEEWFHDFAEGKSANKHTNSNGHATNNQIIPFSELSEYIEHDKGIHIRNNIL